MKDAIRQWLAGDRNYAAGVELYNAHGTNETLKKLFGHGEYSFSRSKLEAALEDLVSGGIAPVPTLTAPPKTATAPASQSANLRSQMRPLLDERTTLHNQLTMYAELNLSQDQRMAIAIRIKQLSRQIEPLYRHLQTCTAPEPEATEDYSTLDRAQLPKKLANLKSQRSKIKKNPDRQAELPEIETKIQQLTDLINKQ